MWSAEEEAWMREVYPDHANAEIAQMHAERFPDRPRRTDKAINSRGKVWGLRKRPGFDRQRYNRRKTWPPERVEWLRSFAPGHSIYEILDEYERLYGIRLTKGAMKNAKLRYDARSGTNAGQFQKGQEPPNKGKTWDELGISEQARENMRRGQFKRGNIPHNAMDKPIGYESVHQDGYTYVKVAERPSRPETSDNFVLKHRMVYEQAHGEIPPDCNIVFADRNPRNFDPDNLVAVPKRLWGTIRKMGLPFHDRETLELCMRVAQLDQARYAAQCAPRECKACGATFKPRQPRQRRCDACLWRAAR